MQSRGRVSVWRIAGFAALVAGAISARLTADDTITDAPLPLAKQVAQLLGELDAAERSTRVAAERRLRELGPVVLPLLPAPELLPSFSVRETVRKLRFELERRKARESVRAAQVSLRGQQPLIDSLHTLSQQSGNRIDGGQLPDAIRSQLLPAEETRGDFWPVLDQLVAKAGVQYRFDAATGALTCVSGAAPAGPLAYDQAVRIEAGPVQIRDIFGEPDQRLWRAPIVIATEPRLRPLFVQYAAADVIAGAAPASRFPPLNPEARYELAFGEGRRGARLQLDFRVPEAERSKSFDLQGKLQITLAAESERIRFGGLDALVGQREAGIARRRGGVTVTLNRVTVNKLADDRGELLIKVDVAYDTGGPAFESHRAWMLHNEVYLERAGGGRMELNGGFETTLLSDGATSLEYRFTDLPLPLPLADDAFVYVAPTLIVDLPVQFHLKAVPAGQPQ